MDIIDFRRILLIRYGYHRLSSDIIALRWMSSTILFPATSPVDNEEAVLVRALLTTAQQESPLGSGCTDAAHEPPVGKEIPTGSGCTNAAHEPPVGKEIPTGSDCTNAAHEPPGPAGPAVLVQRASCSGPVDQLLTPLLTVSPQGPKGPLFWPSGPAVLVQSASCLANRWF